MRIIITALLLLSYAPAAIGQERVDVTTVSRHYVAGEYNEVNPGVFVTVGEPTGVVGGVYYNSFARTSWVVGARYSWDLQDWLVFSVSGGVATGYGNLKPISTQSFVFHANKIGVSFFHFPGAFAIGLTIML